MRDIRIRTLDVDSPDDDQPVIDLCEHIAIEGKITDEKFPEYEYSELLTIKCRLCQGDHLVTIAVN